MNRAWRIRTLSWSAAVCGEFPLFCVSRNSCGTPCGTGALKVAVGVNRIRFRSGGLAGGVAVPSLFYAVGETVPHAEETDRRPPVLRHCPG